MKLYRTLNSSQKRNSATALNNNPAEKIKNQKSVRYLCQGRLNNRSGANHKYKTSGMLKYIALMRSKNKPSRNIPAIFPKVNSTESIDLIKSAILVRNEILRTRMISIVQSLIRCFIGVNTAGIMLATSTGILEKIWSGQIIISCRHQTLNPKSGEILDFLKFSRVSIAVYFKSIRLTASNLILSEM